MFYKAKHRYADTGARKMRPFAQLVRGKNVDEAIEALRSPDLEPFDRAILGDDSRPGRQAILRALGALDRFNRAFSRLADRMGLGVTTRLP